MLGKGESLRNILKKNNHVSEGLENIRVVYFLKKNIKLNMPILTAVYDVLVKKITFDKVIKKLLSRPLVDE